MSIWLTRPADDSTALAELLAAEGITSLIAPVTHIVPRATMLNTKPDALLLTSRHAAHALPPTWQGLPLFCVGQATAQAAQAMGYSNLHVGDDDLLQLLPQITAQLKAGERLLYLSGEDIQLDPAPLLAMRQITCARQVVYAAQAETALPATLHTALADGAITGIVLFSARSAELTCRLLRAAGHADKAAVMDIYCLSLPVAEASASLPWRSIHVSHVPTRDALVATLLAHRARIAS